MLGSEETTLYYSYREQYMYEETIHPALSYRTVLVKLLVSRLAMTIHPALSYRTVLDTKGLYVPE